MTNSGNVDDIGGSLVVQHLLDEVQIRGDPGVEPELRCLGYALEGRLGLLAAAVGRVQDTDEGVVMDKWTTADVLKR